jgi:hypothetical protein
MARKKPKDAAFVLYDVTYEDGTQSSNRKIATADLGPFDGEGEIKAMFAAQDRKIAEASGRPRGPIKAISRSDR